MCQRKTKSCMSNSYIQTCKKMSKIGYTRDNLVDIGKQLMARLPHIHTMF